MNTTRKNQVAFAAILGLFAALPLAAQAAELLPGQPGAITTESAVQQRSAPYATNMAITKTAPTQMVSARSVLDMLKTPESMGF